MALALRLGRTLAELRATMSAAEFGLWQAFDAESPITDDRNDFLAAMVASAAFQAQGAKVKLSDMLPNWGGEPRSEATEIDEESDDVESDNPLRSALLRLAK